MGSEKRRDNKNRILHNGESQRKDGRYMYKYIDNAGKNRYVYSWKLVKTDTIPKGAKNDIPLREKEKLIQKDLDDKIIPLAGEMTVLELVKKYISQKAGVKHNTKENYRFIISIIKKEDFGNKRIDRIKLADAKSWFSKLQEDGRGYGTIHAVKGVVRPAFQMAVDNDYIRKNPFEFKLADVVVNDMVAREALTREQEQEFLEFVKSDRQLCKYYDGIYILFNTGLRISEFAGLTVSDIDFDKERIKVDHQLQRKSNMEYVIADTKTESGTRFIPMTEEVKECFKRIIQNRRNPKVEPIIGDKVGFLYLDRNDMPMVALHWQKCFQRIRKKYDSVHEVPMPKITPHVCRHTFCSKMAKSGMNPKTLQKIMGHSNISVTLNIYTHLDFDDIQKEMKRVCSS